MKLTAGCNFLGSKIKTPSGPLGQHLGLDKDTPEGKVGEPPEGGRVMRRPKVGGLHRRYYREAA